VNCGFDGSGFAGAANVERGRGSAVCVGRLAGRPCAGRWARISPSTSVARRGFRFRRLSGVDAHDEHVRFAWELANDAGEVAVGGIDVGELAQDGRLRRITGFFGDLPAA
jgi:hypothetical protein